MEMTRKGNCLNFNNCSKADRKEIIEVGITEDFICPECESELIDVPEKKTGGKKGLIIIKFLSKKLLITYQELLLIIFYQR